VRQVVDATAAHCCHGVTELMGDSRRQPLTRNRQVAMYVAHKMTGRSLPFIARHIGDRDHTTILHGVRAVEARIAAGDADTIAAINGIAARLTGVAQ
jgi:chromosomal replication initiator protein